MFFAFLKNWSFSPQDKSCPTIFFTTCKMIGFKFCMYVNWFNIFQEKNINLAQAVKFVNLMKKSSNKQRIQKNDPFSSITVTKMVSFLRCKSCIQFALEFTYIFNNNVKSMLRFHEQHWVLKHWVLSQTIIIISLWECRDGRVYFSTFHSVMKRNYSHAHTKIAKNSNG